MTNEYVEKILEDVFKSITNGISDNDKTKAWRSFYRLQNLLKATFDDNNDENPNI